ncbi:tRNA (adenine(58)-N(1))-methyltransferase, mitochondrial isoform X1 [Solea senegalensis]|uniref:tRNA (Adenine(58)-N(1))-methyltransferase, mitochondrial isoform X1 n=1 Tax=Solea senegalensis TaxID=28829 RepID=A0AAV6RY96_SOLSE|nr:tRNA (adenine(58)-N(1))-methyltransferase, mitochondrial [Solea senegalensis]KAG7510337.1 tRNA (adenine(58)-N(1))-methyltransferase, mitochondrial isoform X1 [Solea senegalensis]
MVQIPFSGLMFTHRLVRICTSSQRHVRQRDILVKLRKSRCERRTFSTAPVKFNENENSQFTSRQAPLARRRRPLSPLERVSDLLPQDALNPEVMQLREQQQEGPAAVDTPTAHYTHEQSGHSETTAVEEITLKDSETPERWTSSSSATLPGENLLVFGELLIAEYRRIRDVEFRKMFTLQKGSRLQSSWGFIPHDNMAGHSAGKFLRTNLGVPILVRRASLEDYVLYMRRGPAIAYPKDAAAMLMMMDVTEGDCVLESGSGSGAMSLILSRAVGSKGSVLSVEVREDHLKRTMLNYNRWRTSWSLRRGEEWPDNVQFHNADLCTSSSLLTGWGFNSIALDMINPHLVLPTVIPHLHPGAVCAVYLANITQVTDLLDGVRCLALPLLCEKIIEVPVRHWLVAPAVQKDGQYCVRKVPSLDEDHSEDEKEEKEAAYETNKVGIYASEELSAHGHPPFGSIPYIARPHPEQMSHSAFLVKLRKYVQ